MLTGRTNSEAEAPIFWPSLEESLEESLEKTLMLGKCEGKMRRGCQRMRWLDSVIKAMNMNLTPGGSGRQDSLAQAILFSLLQSLFITHSIVFYFTSVSLHVKGNIRLKGLYKMGSC